MKTTQKQQDVKKIVDYTLLKYIGIILSGIGMFGMISLFVSYQNIFRDNFLIVVGALIASLGNFFLIIGFMNEGLK